MTLDLSKHCIETEIRRLYNRSVSLYLKLGKAEPQLEADIEMLKTALESLDFPSLRSAYRQLAGHSGDCVIELGSRGDGSVAVILDGKEIT